MATVRINELPPIATPLELADLLPFWIAADDKTRYGTLQDLYTLMLGGGTSSHPPVYNEGRLIYIVPAGAAGTQIANIPSLAGKDFLLRREGYPLIAQESPAIPEAEYEVLDSGGFKLLVPGDTLILNQRFELEVYSLIGTSPSTGGGSTASSGSLITGRLELNSNTTINATNHINKLLQIRAASTAITITLPSVSDYPDNAIIPIEANISNAVQSKITTSSGQYIYMGNTSWNSVYIAPGETIWLLRASDGWYVINDFYSNYAALGRPIASYEAGLNYLVCKGQLLSRTANARLWEKVQTFGSSLVTDAVWQTASALVAGRTVENPYRGCYSDGDGSTTFRLPDLMNMFLRGVKTESGSDTERLLNKPGGFQKNEVIAHSHGIPTRNGGGGIGPDWAGNTPSGSNPSTLDYGGVETRPDNVGVLWVIKS
jgi:hypothetical protein